MVVLLLLALPAPVSAAPPAASKEPLVLVAQADFDGVIEQVGVSFHPDGHAELTLNSNTIHRGPVGRLGYYRATVAGGLAGFRANLAVIRDRLKNKRLPKDQQPPRPAVAPHALRILLSGMPVEPTSPWWGELEAFARNPWRYSEWQPIDAIEVEGREVRKLGKGKGPTPESWEKACRERSKLETECRFSRYGVLRLAR